MYNIALTRTFFAFLVEKKSYYVYSIVWAMKNSLF